MASDDTGPERLICLACAWPLIDDATGEQLRDALGFPRFRCGLCIAQVVDRLCECFLCPWLREDT